VSAVGQTLCLILIVKNEGIGQSGAENVSAVGLTLCLIVKNEGIGQIDAEIVSAVGQTLCLVVNRVGQNHIYTPYMTVCMVSSLLKILYVHRIYV